MIQLVQFRPERCSGCLRRISKCLPESFAIRGLFEEPEAAADDIYLALCLEFLLERDYELQLFRRERDAGLGIRFHTESIPRTGGRVNTRASGHVQSPPESQYSLPTQPSRDSHRGTNEARATRSTRYGTALYHGDDLTGIEGNISADPLFCDEIELCLEADSPCLAGNHPHGHDCATVGAREDCGNPTPVEEGSWGRLKVRFRP